MLTLALILAQTTQPVVVNVPAPNEWTPANVTQLLLTLGGIALSIIAAVRGEKANAKGDANAVQVQQIHDTARSLAERVTDVALQTPSHAQQPQTLTPSTLRGLVGSSVSPWQTAAGPVNTPKGQNPQ